MMHKLDFGCGCGRASELSRDRTRYLNWLTENGGFGTYGIDIDPEKVAEAQNHVRPGTMIILADGHETPFPNHFFDYVHVSHSLHHMNYKLALWEINRITKDNGTLYFQEAVDNDPILRLERRIIKNWRGDSVESFFTTDDLIQEIEQYFKIKSIEYHWRFWPSDWLFYFYKEPKISLKFNLWANRIIRKMGWDKRFCAHVVIEAVK